MQIGKSLRCILASLVGLSLMGCKDVKWFADRLLAPEAKWESVELTILAHRMPDHEHGTPVMYWVTRDESGTRAFTPGLAGFDPKWGVEYQVEVAFRESGNQGVFGDVAGSSWRSFERIISETPRAGTEFEISSIGAPWLRDDRRAFIDGQVFTCNDEVCAMLDELASQPESRIKMKLRHGDAPGDLELLGVELESSE